MLQYQNASCGFNETLYQNSINSIYFTLDIRMLKSSFARDANKKQY